MTRHHLLLLGILTLGCSTESPLADTMAGDFTTVDLRGALDAALDQRDGAPQDNTALDLPPSDSTAPDSKSCVPAAPVPTLQLFSQLKQDLGGLSGAARQARVDQFLTAVSASGMFPVRDAQTVILFFVGAPTGALSVAGTFNNWTAGQDKLSLFYDTNLHYLELKLGATRHEYKFVDDSGWFQDPRNEAGSPD